MEILLWLVPAVVVTVVAMAWAAWAGRERPERERTDADRERMAAALRKPMPAARRTPRERSTGVAVRRTGPASDPGQPRRSA